MARGNGGTTAGSPPIVNSPIPTPKAGQARNRQDNLQNYWKKQLPTERLVGYDFRATLIRREQHGKLRILNLDRILTGLNWDESTPTLAAGVTLQNPHADAPLPLKEGHEVKVDWSVAGKERWHNLFRLRIDELNEGASAGTVDVKLIDELQWVARGKDDYSFKKAKKNRPKTGKRTKGWRADQIAREVCRRAGIPVGKLAKGTTYIDNLTMQETNPLKVITEAYKRERKHTGRRFVIAMRDGRLTVKQLRRSSDLLLVGEHLIEATLQRSLKKAFATLVTMTATRKGDDSDEPSEGGSGKKKKREKVEVEVKSSKTAMARYGAIRATWTVDQPVASEAALREIAKRHLARSQEPKQALTMTLPGIATVQRGDALKVDIDQFALTELIYISAVSHTVDGSGNYTMEVTASFEDPFEDKKGEEIREQICKKARENDRPTPWFCDQDADPAAPLPSRQAARNRRDRVGSQDGRR